MTADKIRTEDHDIVDPGLQVSEPLLWERSQIGKCGAKVPRFFTEGDTPERSVPLGFPSVSEPDVVRHFSRLSQRNMGIDTVMYPLGSCTMKYNPRINETIAALAGFRDLHPYFPETFTQGAFSVIADLEQQLTELTGLAATTLAPAAGAHGEFVGLRMIRAYLDHQGKSDKRAMLIPETAHGTNPASCVMAGFEVQSLKAGSDGVLRAQDVRAAMSDRVAGLMMTNPNTLGVWEREVQEIADVLHSHGALLYGDGANMNALVGHVKPGACGFDVMQVNLHKTFSTPHGGGGPGCGPVSVVKALIPFLPEPRMMKRADGTYRVAEPSPRSIGRVKLFWGQFLVWVRAWAYITLLGKDGLREVSEYAVLAARYIQSQLKADFGNDSPACMHEVVFSDSALKGTGIKTLDIAKALMDFGYHPPTTYFPLVVSGALLIEPTECESKMELDRFVATLRMLLAKAKTNPEWFSDRPKHTPIGRVDEALAARQLQVAE